MASPLSLSLAVVASWPAFFKDAPRFGRVRQLSSAEGSESPMSCASSATPSLTHSVSSSRSTSPASRRSSLPLMSAARRNEHLAVLLPKQLWKADSSAPRCDNYRCRVSFTVIERRHHCRKCGGVYCSICTSRSTHLLDTSSLDFLHPPRDIPITVWESPLSPVVSCRVCDDCWEQIHGRCASISVHLDHIPPIAASRRRVSSEVSSLASHLTSRSELLVSKQSLRSATSSSQLSAGYALDQQAERADSISLPCSEKELSLGELDAYPLRRSSLICKRTGGGRWQPEPSAVSLHRLPGCKALYEIEMEQEAEQERLRRLNPVVRHGDFQYRVPQEFTPMIACSPFQLSTF